MSHVLEIDKPLTADEAEQVRTFAEFLVARRPRDVSQTATAPGAGSISVDGWAGCLANVQPELSDKEFMRLIEDERIAQAIE